MIHPAKIKISCNFSSEDNILDYNEIQYVPGKGFGTARSADCDTIYNTVYQSLSTQTAVPKFPNPFEAHFVYNDWNTDCLGWERENDINRYFEMAR